MPRRRDNRTAAVRVDHVLPGRALGAHRPGAALVDAVGIGLRVRTEHLADRRHCIRDLVAARQVRAVVLVRLLRRIARRKSTTGERRKEVLRVEARALAEFKGLLRVGRVDAWQQAVTDVVAHHVAGNRLVLRAVAADAAVGRCHERTVRVAEHRRQRQRKRQHLHLARHVADLLAGDRQRNRPLAEPGLRVRRGVECHDQLLELVLTDLERLQRRRIVYPFVLDAALIGVVDRLTAERDPAIRRLVLRVVAADEVLLVRVVNVDEIVVVEHQLRRLDAADRIGEEAPPGRTLLVPHLDDLDVRLQPRHLHVNHHLVDILEAEEDERGALVLVLRHQRAHRAGEVAVLREECGRALDAARRLHRRDRERRVLPIRLLAEGLDLLQVLSTDRRVHRIRRIGRRRERKRRRQAENQVLHVILLW